MISGHRDPGARCDATAGVGIEVLYGAVRRSPAESLMDSAKESIFARPGREIARGCRSGNCRSISGFTSGIVGRLGESRRPVRFICGQIPEGCGVV